RTLLKNRKFCSVPRSSIRWALFAKDLEISEMEMEQLRWAIVKRADRCGLKLGDCILCQSLEINTVVDLKSILDDLEETGARLLVLGVAGSKHKTILSHFLFDFSELFTFFYILQSFCLLIMRSLPK